MEGWLLALIAGLASFVGSYSAVRVHVYYLRRDVDHAHKRIDEVEKVLRRSP